MRQKDRERIDALERRLSDVERSDRSTRQSNSALFEAVIRCLKKNPDVAKGQRVLFYSGGYAGVGRLDRIQDEVRGPFANRGPYYVILTETGWEYARDVYVIDPS